MTAACGGSGDDDTGEGEGATAGSDGAAALPDRDAPLTALPDVDRSQGFQVDEGTFTIQPGDDVTYCMRIPLPGEAGADLGLVGWDWDLPAYTHHFFMAYSEAPFDSDVPQPCDGKAPIVFNDLCGVDNIPSLAATDGTSPLGEGKLIFGAGVGIGRYVGSGACSTIPKALDAAGDLRGPCFRGAGLRSRLQALGELQREAGALDFPEFQRIVKNCVRFTHARSLARAGAVGASPCPAASGQRTAVKQRPHQETRRHQVATSEPVVHHHGREEDGSGHDEVRPAVFNGLLGSHAQELDSTPTMRARQVD